MSLNNIHTFLSYTTHPELTGNVKFVVNSDGKLYINSFIDTDILSDVRLQSVLIKDNAIVGNDLKDFWESLPYVSSSVIYDRIADTNYVHGPSLNNNSFYKENAKYFAPLYLKNELPTKFIIFKLAETDDIIRDPSNPKYTEFIYNTVYNREIVYTFDLNPTTSAGKYLSKWNENSNIDVYKINDKIIEFSGYNRYNGTFVTLNLELSNPNNFTESVLFDYYKSNNLFSHKMINMEFMFDCEETVVNRLFGMYIYTDDVDVLTLDFNKYNLDFNEYIPKYSTKLKDYQVNNGIVHLKNSLNDNYEYDLNIKYALEDKNGKLYNILYKENTSPIYD